MAPNYPALKSGIRYSVPLTVMMSHLAHDVPMETVCDVLTAWLVVVEIYGMAMPDPMVNVLTREIVEEATTADVTVSVELKIAALVTVIVLDRVAPLRTARVELKITALATKSAPLRVVLLLTVRLLEAIRFPATANVPECTTLPATCMPPETISVDVTVSVLLIVTLLANVAVLEKAAPLSTVRVLDKRSGVLTRVIPLTIEIAERAVPRLEIDTLYEETKSPTTEVDVLTVDTIGIGLHPLPVCLSC